MSTKHAEVAEGRGARRVLAGAAAVAAVLLLVWFGRRAGVTLPRFVEWVDGMGIWGPVAFIGGYAVATVALIPGSLLTLAAGAIFGLVRGTLYTMIGATLGAAGAFLVARYLAREAVERRFGRDVRFRRLDRAVGERGLSLVFLLRLSPALPFTLLNYVLGLTRVRFADYLVASVGMIPGTLLYVYNGKLLGDMAALGSGEAPPRSAAYWAVLGLGLAATVAVTVMVTRMAQRALAQRTGIPEEPAS